MHAINGILLDWSLPVIAVAAIKLEDDWIVIV